MEKVAPPGISLIFLPTLNPGHLPNFWCFVRNAPI